MGSSNHTRTSVKHVVQNIADKLRSDCLRRSSSRRQELLAQRRTGSTNQGAVEADLRQIVREAVSQQLQSTRSSCQLDPFDEEIEREIRAFSDEEVAETSRLLEEQIFSELIAQHLADHLADLQEQELREQFEAYFDQGDGSSSQQAGEAAAAAASSHEGAEQVLCPVCLSANLVHLHGFIACPKEGWQLDVRSEGTTLGHLRQQLAAVYQAHGECANCPGQLKFSLESCVGFVNLTGRCSTCGLLQIVV